MRNFVQPGSVVRVPAPAAVVSGQGIVVGDLFGVATSDAASGAELELMVTGCFRLPATGGSAGAKAFWSGTAATTDDAEGANLAIGHFLGAAVDGKAVIRLAP